MAAYAINDGCFSIIVCGPVTDFSSATPAMTYQGYRDAEGYMTWLGIRAGAGAENPDSGIVLRNNVLFSY